MRKYTQTEVGLPKIEDTPFLAVPMQWRVWRTREFGVSPMFWTSCRVLWVQATDHFALQFFEGAAGSVNHLHQETATVLKVFQKHHAHSCTIIMVQNMIMVNPWFMVILSIIWFGIWWVYGHPNLWTIPESWTAHFEWRNYRASVWRSIFEDELHSWIGQKMSNQSSNLHRLRYKSWPSRPTEGVNKWQMLSKSPGFYPTFKKWLVTNQLRSVGWSTKSAVKYATVTFGARRWSFSLTLCSTSARRTQVIKACIGANMMDLNRQRYRGLTIRNWGFS